MKKTVGLIITLCLLSNFIFANTDDEIQRKNELQIKVGALPAVEMLIGTLVSAFSAIGESIADDGGNLETHTLPTISLEYMHRLDDINAIGASVSWGTPAYNVIEKPEGKEKKGISYVSAMFKYRASYVTRENFYLYGGLGIGAEVLYSFGLEAEAENSLVPCVAIQGTPVGIWFGGDRVFGTLELSIGSEGSGFILGGGIRF